MGTFRVPSMVSVTLLVAFVFVLAACEQNDEPAEGGSAPERAQQERTIEITETVEFAAGSITVSELQLLPDETTVTYSIDFEDALPFGAFISLRLPDGTVHRGHGGDDQTMVDGTDERTDYFPPLPGDIDTIHIEFPRFSIIEDEPVEVTFPIPEGLAGITPTMRGERVEEPVGYEFEIDGQPMEVVHVAVSGHENATTIQTVVQNHADAETTNGLIQLGGPSAVQVTLTDDTGYEYSMIGGGLGVDQAGHQFQRPINEGATELTLRSEQRGRLITPPDPIEVPIASE